MTTIADTERTDFLQTLRLHRGFLRHTVRDLADDQLAVRSTASELTLGGLLKHVAATEKQWAGFIVDGPWRDEFVGPDAYARHHAQFQVTPEDTVASLLAGYDEVAAATDRLVLELPDLNVAHPLPEAPWFEPGATWSARRVLLHIVAETAQHAGHADIIRESIDGAKTMG